MNQAKFRKSNEHKQNIIKHQETDSTRLNKYIGDSGFCSRRDADVFIAAGKVTIDGVKAVIGTKVYAGQVVKIDKKVITPSCKKVYILLNKPTGIICTNDLNTKNNIRVYINYPDLIYPIGRLDKDSSGIILLTNDGDIVNKILRAENAHEKEYIVTLNKDISDEFVNKMKNGVLIYNQVAQKDQITSKCHIEKTDNRTFRIILKQGLNRQIRRMCEVLGYNVLSLKRIRIMNIRVGNLNQGEWRFLTDKELMVLNDSINSK